MSRTRLLAALEQAVLLGDGAMGTQLQHAGLESGGCGEAWNLDHPERVLAIQRAYVEAWAELLRPLRPDLSDDERRTAVHAAIGLLNSTGYRRQVGLPRAQAEDLLAGMALRALLHA